MVKKNLRIFKRNTEIQKKINCTLKYADFQNQFIACVRIQMTPWKCDLLRVCNDLILKKTCPGALFVSDF